jgi:hypothetical protein
VRVLRLKNTKMRKLSTLLKATITACAVICLVGSGVNVAQATTAQDVELDCSTGGGGSLAGTIYLFPEEELVIDYLGCAVSVSVDGDTDPDSFTSVQTLLNGNGRIIFSGDGTYTLTGTRVPFVDASLGPLDGIWRTASNPMAYMNFSLPGDMGPLAMIRVQMAGNNVTSIDGKRLQSTNSVAFPPTVELVNTFQGERALGECVDDRGDSDVLHSYVFAATRMTASGGDYTMRTISTTPTSSFTGFLANPTQEGFSNPLKHANYLIYSEFDPAQPAQGLLGCGTWQNREGDYLNSGEFLEGEYSQIDIHLEPGDYTLVTVIRIPMTVDDWNQGDFFFGSTPELISVNLQVWVGDGVETGDSAATGSVPSLASTGYSADYQLPVMTFIVGLILLVVSRKRRTS